jgi:hypothetical protein
MRRALLIGIDNYPTAPLGGCVEDVERLHALVERHGNGDRNFDCRVLTAPTGGATLDKVVVQEAIERLLAKEASSALLHFSGHGVVNDLGGFIVTSDGRRYDEGISMHHLLRLVNQSSIPEITILLDCCHSGAMGAEGRLEQSDAVLLREGVAILAASGKAEVSVETERGGLFTQLVCDALEGQAADMFGRVTLPGIYGHVDGQLGAWDQRPRFRANLRALTPLRNAAPLIPLATLRRLPELFESPTASHKLSPAHEPSNVPHDDMLEVVFEELQRLCRRGLVEPVGEEHMYYAAIRSGACRLTLQGQRYWRLAKHGRI